MRFECMTKTEKAWLVASVVIYITHRLMQVSPGDFYNSTDPLRLCLELAMILLSFPFGVLTLFIVDDAMYWCDGCRELGFLLDSPTLLFAGYIQWFWVLPEVLRGRKLTLLDLKSQPKTISPDASPAVAEATHAPCDAAPLDAFDAAAFVPRFAEFDAAGRTALDKVFQAQAASAPRAPSPSHAEAIFPRVS